MKPKQTNKQTIAWKKICDIKHVRGYSIDKQAESLTR